MSFLMMTTDTSPQCQTQLTVSHIWTSHGPLQPHSATTSNSQTAKGHARGVFKFHVTTKMWKMEFLHACSCLLLLFEFAQPPVHFLLRKWVSHSQQNSLMVVVAAVRECCTALHHDQRCGDQCKITEQSRSVAEIVCVPNRPCASQLIALHLRE